MGSRRWYEIERQRCRHWRSRSWGLAAVLSRNLISAVSRHRQRGREFEQGVSPGGKTLTHIDEHLDDYCRQQFALEPGFGSEGIGLFQMASGKNRLKPFESQCHLPAAAV